MLIQQLMWTDIGGWQQESSDPALGAPDLVLYFAARESLTAARYDEIVARFPGSPLVGCTTGGEILGEDVIDGSIAVTGVWFERGGRVVLSSHHVGANEESGAIGAALAAGLPRTDLKGVLVLSDGTQVNGSGLVAGLREALGDDVVITGGLAGDGARFQTTLVGCGAPPRSGVVAAVGFYGERMRLRHGCYGGWDRFGPERSITRAQGNVLYELDGEPALDLYKRYLGDEAARLPASALLFPLLIRSPLDDSGDLVRTIVAVDEAAKTMTFAGDMPQGHVAQLMRGHFDHLVDGAQRAAEHAAAVDGRSLAILVSCIGRKLLMGQRIVEEVEAVAATLGPEARLTGFYSYGEISPHDVTGRCELHNQTMTITVLSEA